MKNSAQTTETDYRQEALDFAAKHGITLKVNSSTFGRHFADDKQSRHIFSLTLKRNGELYRFKFGQSINAGAKNPTMYDVLTCLQKSDVGSFEDFCSEFGYDTDSRKAFSTYKAVEKEFKAVERLFGDILEELQEIQ
mgnify:CR=1 FL=1